jgi:hypothetical protein
VPFSQSVDYVRRTQEAGGTATLVEVTGGHFGVVETDSPAWSRVRDIFDGLR